MSCVGGTAMAVVAGDVAGAVSSQNLEARLCGPVPDGGAFGVAAGLGVFDALDRLGARSQRPLDGVMWTNQQGSRFAPGLMGCVANTVLVRLANPLIERAAQGSDERMRVTIGRWKCSPRWPASAQRRCCLHPVMPASATTRSKIRPSPIADLTA